MRTYEISKGQQYDKDGATVKYGRNRYAKYDSKGKFQAGDFPPVYDQDEIGVAVLRVIATGQDEIITCGKAYVPTEADKIAAERAERLRQRMEQWEHTDI